MPRNEQLLQGYNGNDPSIFRGIFSKQNYVANPRQGWDRVACWQPSPQNPLIKICTIFQIQIRPLPWKFLHTETKDEKIPVTTVPLTAGYSVVHVVGLLHRFDDAIVEDGQRHNRQNTCIKRRNIKERRETKDGGVSRKEWINKK